MIFSWGILLGASIIVGVHLKMLGPDFPLVILKLFGIIIEDLLIRCGEITKKEFVISISVGKHVYI